MLKYELATSMTLNIEKYCYSYWNGLAYLWCLRGGTHRREFRYIYKPGNPSRTRVFVSRFSNDNEEFQWNSIKYSIDNDNLWNTSVYFYLFWFRELKSTKTGIGALRTNFTFQCWDQDPCPEDLHADALLHVSVSVKRIFLIYLTFNCAYILLLLRRCVRYRPWICFLKWK